MPNGIIVIDKPQDWTASEHALLERPSPRQRGLSRRAAPPFRVAPALLGCAARKGACYA